MNSSNIDTLQIAQIAEIAKSIFGVKPKVKESNKEILDFNINSGYTYHTCGYEYSCKRYKIWAWSFAGGFTKIETRCHYSDGSGADVPVAELLLKNALPNDAEFVVIKTIEFTNWGEDRQPDEWNIYEL